MNEEPALYNFNLMTPEGVDRIMALLPILDDGIIKALYQEAFPGYPLDSISPRIARIELRGFFKDFLDSSLSLQAYDEEGSENSAAELQSNEEFDEDTSSSSLEEQRETE